MPTDVAALPEFLRVAAHPLRWRLLSELARSDRRGRELTQLLGERQSLVAYHLGQLRAGKLVRAHRSSADGRDVYYRLDLARCRDQIAAAMGALHPGLVASPAMVVRTRVLFLCTGNSARSQLAEALLRARTDGTVKVASAGSHPRALEPGVATLLAARGIDATGLRAKPVDEVADAGWDLVITLCDRVREACPEVDAAAEQIHWSVPPPAHGDPAALAAVADELEVRVAFLVDALGHR